MTTWHWLWETKAITIHIPRLALLLIGTGLIAFGIALLGRAIGELV